MHTCPECGSPCFCGGDVDDIDTGDTEAEDNCTCCVGGDGDEEDDEGNEGDDDEEDDDYPFIEELVEE